MGRLLRQIGLRYVIGLAVIIVVALVIVIARAFPHSTLPPLVSGPVTATGPVTAQPSTVAIAPGGVGPSGAGPSGAGPSIVPLHSPVPPVTAKGAATPQHVAVEFADAWLDHDGSAATTWLHRVTAYTTADVAGQLANADPANVPAEHRDGSATVADNTADSCVVRVPTDAGTLILTMNQQAGQWLVGNIDWTSS
jgi:hypothetical protein